MRYDLNCEIDICRFKHRVASLISRRCIVELTDKKPIRTSSQNKYLHCILGEFAMQTGCTLSYVKTEYFKRFCNPELFVRVEFDELMHKEIERLRSSRDLDTGEMRTAIERFRNWAAAEAGIDLPAPDEAEWIGFIEREMQHQQIWL